MKKMGSSQNKKIAVSAVSVFVVSLSMMMFFLGNGGGLENGQANLLKSGGHGASEVAESHESGLSAEDLALEKSYRDELGGTTDPVFVLTPSGKFKYAAEGFCELLRKECDVLIGKLFYNFINSKDLPNLISSLTEIISKNPEKQVIGPFRMLREKEEMVVMFTVVPLKNGKEVNGVLFSVKDITEQVSDLDHLDESLGENVKAPDGENSNEKAPVKDDWLKVLYPKFQELEDSKVVMKAV